MSEMSRNKLVKSVIDYLNASSAVKRVQKERFGPKDEINWEQLTFIVRPDLLAPRILDIKEARLRLKLFLDQREQRYEILSHFLSDNSVVFEQTEESVNAVNAFFSRNVYSNEAGTDIHPNWISFIWNYALFLGDMAITQAKEIRQLHWVVENIAPPVLGDHLRVVFEVGGYSSKAANFRPDETLMLTGRWMLKSKETDLTAGGRRSDPYFDFSNKLAQSLRCAEAK